MQDISGFGTVVSLIASKTFPAGLAITSASDDAPYIEMDSVKIGDATMGVNGDLITWNRAVPLPFKISVIPGSLDDVNLSILANNNRVGKGKTSAQDVITVTIVYPDGSTLMLTNGKILDAMFGKSVESSGRIKTRVFNFAFEANSGQ